MRSTGTSILYRFSAKKMEKDGIACRRILSKNASCGINLLSTPVCVFEKRVKSFCRTSIVMSERHVYSYGSMQRAKFLPVETMLASKNLRRVGLKCLSGEASLSFPTRKVSFNMTRKPQTRIQDTVPVACTNRRYDMKYLSVGPTGIYYPSGFEQKKPSLHFFDAGRLKI
jgi:hypothetical protein